MTEFEINKAVADKLRLKYRLSQAMEIIFINGCEIYNPCNNARQSWEIMMEYNISVTKGDDGNYDAFQGLYCAGHTTFYYENCLTHEKPLVAAMLCFLEINK